VVDCSRASANSPFLKEVETEEVHAAVVGKGDTIVTAMPIVHISTNPSKFSPHTCAYTITTVHGIQKGKTATLLQGLLSHHSCKSLGYPRKRLGYFFVGDGGDNAL
jgi:hypothetical protein